MTAAALPAGGVERWAASGAVASGLALAQRGAALTFIAVPAPLTSS